MCKDTFWALAEAKPLGCDGKITRAPLIGVTVLVPAVAVKIIIPLHHMISIFFSSCSLCSHTSPDFAS